MTEFAFTDCSCCHLSQNFDGVRTNPSDDRRWCDDCFEWAQWAVCRDCELWFHRSTMHAVPKTGSATYTHMCTSCRDKRIMRARRFAG